MPSERGIEPGYEERHFSEQERRGQLRLIASADRAQGSVLIHQDVRVYAGLFDGDESARLQIAPHRRVYLHVARGQINADGAELAPGDALKLTATGSLVLRDARQAEVLVFDLPGAPAAAGH
jgi:redox-sensitive bicupin YhaK (pirin superfamily)